jgi:hypothetical protein
MTYTASKWLCFSEDHPGFLVGAVYVLFCYYRGWDGFAALSAVLRIPDLYVVGPPESGSGFVSQRCGSGSGSVYHKAKIVRKILIPLFCEFFMTLSLKNDVNIPLKSNKLKKRFLLAS